MERLRATSLEGKPRMRCRQYVRLMVEGFMSRFLVCCDGTQSLTDSYARIALERFYFESAE